MSDTNEFIIDMLEFIVGFWPVVFLAVLQGFIKRNRRRGFWSLLRLMFKSMSFTWLVFAVMWLTLKFLGGQPFQLVHEPANSQVFWGIGTIIILIWGISFSFDWLKRRRDFENVRELKVLHNLSPSEFEEIVAETFRRLGHRAKLVGKTGDHGVDVHVRAGNGEKWVVQCKRYKGSVGEPMVRDLYGTMLHEEAHRAAIVTTGKFSRQAQAWAQGKPIDLYDGESFMKVMRRVQRSNTLYRN